MIATLLPTDDGGMLSVRMTVTSGRVCGNGAGGLRLLVVCEDIQFHLSADGLPAGVCLASWTVLASGGGIDPDGPDAARRSVSVAYPDIRCH